MFSRFQLMMLVLITLIAAFLSTFAFARPGLPEQAQAVYDAWAPLDAEAKSVEEQLHTLGLAYEELQEMTVQSEEHLEGARQSLAHLIDYAAQEKAGDEQQRQLVEQMLQASRQHTEETQDALDMILSKMLGDPVGQTFGKRSTIKVFSLQEAGYRGYMAKVKLHDPSAVRLVLSGDRVGDRGETTSQAARRTNAVLAVNGGGFTRQNGLLYPIGITVVDGEIKTFYQTDLSFIGFDKNGRLVGGEVKSREQIKEMNVMHGASFVPTLLKDGKKQPIPAKWRNRKEPRTMIGHFSNGDLLFIVIDGRQKGHSIGVTLEEAQDKLLEFKVRDAYNLDGGGSSTFYYNGKVLNQPSDGRERRMPTNIVILP